MNIIGIDLGGTNIAAARLQNGELTCRTREKTNKESAEGIVLQLKEAVDRVLERANLRRDELDGIGVAVPGWVDAQNGIVCSSPNLPLRQVPLAQQLEALCGCPVRIENDANCAALGELYYGDAQGLKDFVLLTVGTGLGAGVVMQGRVLGGVGATELAHVVMQMDGPLCGCGRYGCTETFTSATALLRIAGETLKRFPDSRLNKQGFVDGEAIFDAYRGGDRAALQMVEEYTGYFAQAILNLIAIFGSVPIFIGGGIAEAKEGFFVPLLQKLEEAAAKTIYAKELPQIAPAGLLNNAGIYGAAALFEKREETV